MHSCLIKSFKHDGSSHRLWMYLDLIKEDENFFYLAAKRAKVIEHDGREWRAQEGALYIMSKNRFYNVICMFTSPNKVSYYVNIASNSLIDKTCIMFIDYDLDLKKGEDKKVKEIDWGEYKENTIKYGYSNKLQKVIELTLKEVELDLKNGIHPFDDAENMKTYENYLLEKKEVNY